MALLDAAVVLVTLLGCSVLGLGVRPLLSERHRNREVIEFVQLVVAMLVTFAALVLRLLTSSVKSSYDNVGELGIRELAPHNPMQRRLETTCIAQYERLAQTRWRLIEESVSSISTPFLIVLVFWLAVVFTAFGLHAPRNLLSYVTIALAALSIASAIFVILDLDTPFQGIFMVSSEPLRHALVHLSE